MAGRGDGEGPDEARFPAFRLAMIGGAGGAVMNVAEEAAFKALAEERIGYWRMAGALEGGHRGDDPWLRQWLRGKRAA